MIFRWRAQPNQLLRLALSSFQNQGISNRYYCQVECYRKPLLQSSYTNNANTTPISTNYLPTPATPGNLALAMGSEATITNIGYDVTDVIRSPV